LNVLLFFQYALIRQFLFYDDELSMKNSFSRKRNQYLNEKDCNQIYLIDYSINNNK